MKIIIYKYFNMVKNLKWNRAFVIKVTDSFVSDAKAWQKRFHFKTDNLYLRTTNFNQRVLTM